MLSSLKAALVLVQFVVALTIAAPFDTHEIHEKRDFVPAGWQQGQRLDEAFILPIQIGLKQSNIDKLHDMLMSVSLPDSPEYGQHWTPEKVRATFAPSKESRETVISWLIESGIDSYRLDHSKASGGWIKFNASVAEAEALFKTQYYGWSHPLGKRGSITPAVRSSYSLPAHVRSHVDFITPTLHFNVKLDLRRGLRQNEAISLKTKKKKKKKSRLNYLGSPGGPVSPVIRPIPAGTHISAVSLATCASLITPNCLRALYGIPTLATNTRTNPSNSLGIVEYTPQQYIPSDMLQFFSNFSTQQVQRTPTMVSIDGGSINYNTPSSSIFAYSGESNLDLQYAMALVNPLKVTLYQTGDQTEGASFGDFLDALDSSYCAGDDPMQDAVYPDPYFSSSSNTRYTGAKACGGNTAAKVISTSYGYNEADLLPAYEIRQCNEYAKLGLMGTTFVFSSGDYGTAGNGNECIDPSTGQSGTTSTCTKFNPSFPGTCPYILSVGATQIAKGGTVTTPEVASNSVIYSGGGFSNIFGMPSYQSSAVQSYFTNHLPAYTSTQYNNSQTSRGFPDVSANGAYYGVVVGGTLSLVFGTSASAPVFASVLTLINEARMNLKKSSLGFVNPVFYANPGMFNDITSGNNPGCQTSGFSAVSGWDPVTGLGTPNYTRMIQYFTSH